MSERARAGACLCLPLRGGVVCFLLATQTSKCSHTPGRLQLKKNIHIFLWEGNNFCYHSGYHSLTAMTGLSGFWVLDCLVYSGEVNFTQRDLESTNMTTLDGTIMFSGIVYKRNYIGTYSHAQRHACIRTHTHTHNCGLSPTRKHPERERERERTNIWTKIIGC